MMNREQIVKALECCLRNDSESCPYFALYKEHRGAVDCTDAMIADALALLREKDAEIERLKDENSELRLKMSYMKEPNTIGDIHEMGAW